MLREKMDWFNRLCTQSRFCRCCAAARYDTLKPRASERVNELTDCFSADTFPSLKRRGGCGINKKARSLRSAADGVVSSAKLFRPKDFADLTTPSARTKVASRHFLDRASTPPFQGGE